MPDTHPPTPRRRPVVPILAAVCAVLAILSAALGAALLHRSTAQSSPGQAVTAASDRQSCSRTLTVVASVNQWGSLAKELGGDCVAVTSLINSTSADPHGYEATPSDLAQLARADVVVLNGAGYDGWAEQAQLDASRQRIVNVGELMGVAAVDEDDHDHDDADGHHHHGAVNPHLWFSPDAVLKAAGAITDAYAAAGDGTAAVAQRLSNEWNGRYAQFVSTVNQARASGTRRSYVATESIIGYLLEYVGTTDRTPAAYTNAMNQEGEPSPADFREALAAVPTADLLIVNPQEMDGFATQLRDAAQDSGRTVVSVSEQLPERYATLLDWLGAIARQVIAQDSANGWFLTQDVKDRTIGDYAGEWQSVFPYLEDGTLKPVMEHKAAQGSQSVEEVTEYYTKGYRSDVTGMAIEGDAISFTTEDDTVTARYRYDGYRILDYAKGNRGVRYLFTAVGDVPEGAPRAVQFSDHGITPGKAAHFHVFTGEDHEEVLKEMDNWPTFYPAGLDGPGIVREMLAH